MNLDDKVCYCFHVTRRKLENFVRRERPQVVSQLSQCGGAGTGCGWCIPFLKQIFNQNLNELDQVSPSDYATQARELCQKWRRHAAARRGAAAGSGVVTLRVTTPHAEAPDGGHRGGNDFPSAKSSGLRFLRWPPKP